MYQPRLNYALTPRQAEGMAALDAMRLRPDQHAALASLKASDAAMKNEQAERMRRCRELRWTS